MTHSKSCQVSDVWDFDIHGMQPSLLCFKNAKHSIVVKSNETSSNMYEKRIYRLCDEHFNWLKHERGGEKTKTHMHGENIAVTEMVEPDEDHGSYRIIFRKNRL